MNRVRILTDSTSDVPPELAAQLGIVIVPAYVQIAGRSYRDDGIELTREDFYARLEKLPDPPTTAVPPAEEFAAAYRSLIGEADAVVAIVLASSLSGMINVASLGAEGITELDIHVVDSGQVTMGLGWLVVAAAEAAAKGQSAAEILNLVETLKPRVHVYAALDTVEYLRRSGRVSWARAKVAQILNVKPILDVYMGEVRNAGRTRTRRQAITHVAEMARALGPLERMAILHSKAPDVEALRAQVADLYSPDQTPTIVITPVLGAHLGPRGLGVAVVATT